MSVRPNKRGPRVGPRTPRVKWLEHPVSLVVRGGQCRIVGVAADAADADAVFAELEREGQHDERRQRDCA
jgi:hypothetical protein